MTRFLSAALEAPEPFFRLGLKRLEAAHGNPSADIQLSAEVRRRLGAKLPMLGLDPQDTTPQELYHALQERVRLDDERLVKTLRTLAATHISAEGDVVAGMIYALQHLQGSRRCYGLKSSSFRALMKRQPPKKTMKRLGYRSMTSFLKHETPVSMLSAALLLEGNRWHQKLLVEYKRLQPSDFEMRTIAIEPATFKRAAELASKAAFARKHNVLTLTELGTVVILPFPAETPAGGATASLTLALHGLNTIRETASYLKLAGVRADFGRAVREVVAGEPRLDSELLDQAVSWQLVQRYYAEHPDHFSEDLFEPHLQLEDMVWEPVEKALSRIEPSFSFWLDSAHLGMMHGNKPVSCNLLDAALNYCNRLPFERRLAHHFQRSLWHELLTRYLKPQAVEQAAVRQLQPAYAAELIEA